MEVELKLIFGGVLSDRRPTRSHSAGWLNLASMSEVEVMDGPTTQHPDGEESVQIAGTTLHPLRHPASDTGSPVEATLYDRRIFRGIAVIIRGTGHYISIIRP